MLCREQNSMTKEEHMNLLIDEKYPLSAKHKPEFVFDNKMDSQSLWLVESLARMMILKLGMCVLIWAV